MVNISKMPGFWLETVHVYPVWKATILEYYILRYSHSSVIRTRFVEPANRGSRILNLFFLR